MTKKIGKVSKKVIEILKLDYEKEESIYIGNTNIEHIKRKHPIEFKKYGNKIKDIIKNPTYIARNEKKKSIEFIKKYRINNDYVIVVVRVSDNNIHFVRTMYTMSKEKIKKYFHNNFFHIM